MSNLPSLLFYLVVFSMSAVIFYIGNKNNNKVIKIFSLAIPIIVAGIRFEVGTDYESYALLANSLGRCSVFDYVNYHFLNLSYEPGFYIISKMSFGIPAVLFTLSSIVTVIFFYLGIEKLHINNKSLIYFLYLLILFPFTFNAVRQGISVSIFFYALTFAFEKKLCKFILWSVVASMFHASVLMLMPICILIKFFEEYVADNNKKMLKYLFVMVFLINVSVALFFKMIILVPGLDKYGINSSNFIGGINYFLLISQSLTMVSIILIYKFSKYNKHLQHFVVLSLVGFAFTIMSVTNAYLGRFFYYFIIFNSIVITSLIDIKLFNRYKKYLYILIIMYGILYFVLYYYRIGGSEIFPYKLIFEKL